MRFGFFMFAPAGLLAATPLAAQPPAAGGAPGQGWTTNVVIMRVDDAIAERPDSARMISYRGDPWVVWRNVRTPPAGLGDRPLRNDSYVLLEVGPAGEAAGCRPLRASAEPRLDAFACALLMEPGYFQATLLPPPAPLPAQRWVMGLSFETRKGGPAVPPEAWRPALAPAPSPPPPRAAPSPQAPPPAPSTGPRHAIGGSILATHYAGIEDLTLANGDFVAELSVDAQGRVTDCRVARSTGNAAVDARSCELLRPVRYTIRVDAAGNPIADVVSQPIDLGWVLHGTRP